MPITVYPNYIPYFKKVKGEYNVISYEPLWKTMKLKGATTYTLQYKGDVYNVSSSTIRRLKAGESVSTNTLDTLCKILKCSIPEIIEFIDETN